MQVEGQRKEVPQPVVIKGEKKWEVEKIMNKRKIQGCNDEVVETTTLSHLMLSRQTINFGNISDIWNIIIIINGSQERIGSPDITTRSPVVYLRTLSE